MRVSLIAAMSETRAIGVENRLPWNLPEDLKRFRELTSGHAVIMGRKTHESIGRLLPNRRNIIISRQPGYRVEGAMVVSSLEGALAACDSGESEAFVIGGAEIYRLALPRADRLYLTLIHERIPGDAFFPEFDPGAFRETSREEREASTRYSFVVLDRIRGAGARP
jgi:dihydrofolate reductase